MKKWFNARPAIKKTLVLVVLGIWTLALVGMLQRGDLIPAAKYVGISLLLIAVARL